MKSLSLSTLLVVLAVALGSAPIQAQTFTSTFNFPTSFEVALPTADPCCTYSWAISPLQVDASVAGQSVLITDISVTGNATVNGQQIGGFDWVILAGPSSFGFPTGGQTYVSSGVDPFSLTVAAPLLFHFAEGGIPFSVINGNFNFLTGIGATPCCAVNNFILAASEPFSAPTGLYVQMLLYTGDPRTDLLVSNIQLTLQGQISSASAQYLGSPGSATNPTASIAEPVNTATGNFYSSITDLAVPGRGKAFVFNRYYNSLDSYSGPLGHGWTHTYNILLTKNPTNGSVTIKQQDGSIVTFAANGSGGYSPSTIGLFDKLQQNADGTFLLTKTNQVRFTFSAAGKLLFVSDRNENTQQLAYNKSGDLTSITDTVGRVFVLGYDSNHHLIYLADPSGRVVSYVYDGNGNLISSTNPIGGVTQYSYDSQFRLIAAVNPRGVTYIQNTFDSEGRVIAQKNGRGITTSLAYGTPSAGITTITDGNGNTSHHVYDANLRLVAIVDGNGAKDSFTYDSNNERTTITDANGNIKTFVYDSFGNLTKFVGGLGGVTTFAYTNLNDVSTITDAKGNSTLLEYDAYGNVAVIVDALGNVTGK